MHPTPVSHKFLSCQQPKYSVIGLKEGFIYMVRVMFIGDIVGRPGREFIANNLKKSRDNLGLDLVIANAENSAGIVGITAAIANDLAKASIDGITLGDHVWDQRGFSEDINKLDFVCRPANLPKICPGRDHLILKFGDFRVAVFTVLGRTFMKIKAECPFLAVDEMIKKIGDNADAIIVEIHAEATSEKVALGRYLDGRVALVVGTHTHVPTADARIFPKGTAYLTDVGMTGPYDSILGTEIDTVIGQFLDGMPRRYTAASGEVRLGGCIVDIDEETGLAVKFEPVCIVEEEEANGITKVV